MHERHEGTVDRGGRIGHFLQSCVNESRLTILPSPMPSSPLATSPPSTSPVATSAAAGSPISPSLVPLSPVPILKAYDRAMLLDRAQLKTLDDFPQAQAIARDLQAIRLSRGEKHLGYKIGFTNRGIWPLYGVSRPIWAPVYDTTVMQLPGHTAQLGLHRFVQPRLEPEIVIGMASTPADTSIEALTDAIAWVAHGFEVVQSHFLDWKFSAAEAHACQGLHGCLLIGPRASPSQFSEPLAQALSGAKLVLAKFVASNHVLSRQGAGDFKVMAQGQGANVLDGPIQALAFLAKSLAEQGETLKAGQMITTGTLTDAMPIAAGELWRTQWVSSVKGRQKITNKVPQEEPDLAFALSGLELRLT